MKDETPKLSEMTEDAYRSMLNAARKYGARAGFCDAHQVAVEGADNLRAWLEDSPTPLSGEWADGLTPQALADELGVEDDTPDLELSQAFEDGYHSAVQAWVETYYPSVDAGERA